MYSGMNSSGRPESFIHEFDAFASLTADEFMADEFTSRVGHKMRQAICFSVFTSLLIAPVAFQKMSASALKVLSKRLLPLAKTSTTSSGVCFFRMASNAITTSKALSKASACPALSMMRELSKSRMTGMAPACWDGTTCTNACTSSVGMLAFSCRKMATVLLSSSTTMRVESPGLGPMVPKTGNCWNWVAQCVMMCSPSSILPTPVGPSMTTTPPSANGLLAGAFIRGALVAMIGSCSERALLAGLPSISDTLAMALHLLIEQRFCTFFLQSATGSFARTSEPSMGLSYQGKRIFRSTVRPICPVLSLRDGLKMLIALDLPLTLMGAKALKSTSPVECLLVSSSVKTPRGGALDIRRADRLTQSPRTVYSIRFALPQTPQ
mmetsp:Transcript_43998/g.71296  ORF Transcript_43998/g.71296 Transcript_43998/m.71296 type:complete len:380 (-) Transcript_43998:1405-2544(-)